MIEKFVSIINSKTGNTVYLESYGSSTGFKEGELKDIKQAIEKSNN